MGCARMNVQISSVAWKSDEAESVLDISAVSTRSGTPEDSPANRKIYRSQTAPLVFRSEGDALSDCKDVPPIRKSKTVPGLNALRLDAAYPVDLVVRNTFLEFAEEKLEQVRPRLAWSAPSTPQSKLLGQEDGEQIFCVTENNLVSVAPLVLQEPPSSNPQGPSLLELASLLADPFCGDISMRRAPAFGSLEMPSEGSRGHDIGECKPCAFFWKA